jgi:hypothetical protein
VKGARSIKVFPPQSQRNKTEAVPIPPLNVDGLLPPGIHDCTLGEAQAAFVNSNPSRRSDLWQKLDNFLNWVRPMKLFRAIYVDGSFVTDKAAPGDIDVVLELPPAASGLIQQIDLRLLDYHYLYRTFELDIYFWHSGSPSPRYDLRGFFQYLRQKDATARGLKPGAKKGILRIAL